MVTDFYHPYVGGVEVVVRNLARELSARGHDVSVATIGTSELPEYEEDGAVRVHRIRSTTRRLDALFSQRRTWAPPVPDPEAIAGLRRVAAVEAPQIVHGHDWLARSFLPVRTESRVRFIMSLHYYTVSCAKKTLVYRGAPCTGPALTKCTRCGSAHYGVAKGSAVVAGNFIFAAAERRAVDLFIPVSEATAAGNRLVDSGLPYEVIPNFVADSDSLGENDRQLPDLLPEGDFLLYVGDLRKEKGIEVLFDAYRGLTDAPPLVVIGKIWPDSPRELPPNVRVLTGWQNEDVREAQRSCLALLAPSVWPEPFGMVIIEALAAGRPVIASRIAGMAELVEDRVNGLLVPPGDAAALGEAIASLLRDGELVASLAEHASHSVAPFRAAAVVPRFERAYARAIDSPPRGPTWRPPGR
jgi:glycosyltransferase involved in cell wall biosynthesis